MNGPHEQSPSSPPKGDYQKSEKYISKLVQLLDQDKVEVIHTDLNKFDPGSIQDHYRVDLKEYQIELSHSKLPNNGTDSFVMIFTNFKNVEEGSAEKVILAYTQLSDNQFSRFKKSADEQLERFRKLAEERRFNQAIEPIDQLLDSVLESTHQAVEEKSHHEHHPHHASSGDIKSTAAAEETKNSMQFVAPETQPQIQDPTLSQRADNLYRVIS